MRKILITVTALVVFGATAAIAAVGPSADADLTRDQIQAHDCDQDCDGTPDRIRLQLQDGSCLLDTVEAESVTGDVDMTQTQTQTQTQSQTQDGDCDHDCDGTQEQEQEQERAGEGEGQSGQSQGGQGSGNGK